MLAHVLMKMGQWPELVNQTKMILQRFPDLPPDRKWQTVGMLGHGYLRQERNKLALETFKQEYDLGGGEPRPSGTSTWRRRGSGAGTIYQEERFTGLPERTSRRSTASLSARNVREGPPSSGAPVPGHREGDGSRENRGGGAGFLGRLRPGRPVGPGRLRLRHLLRAVPEPRKQVRRHDAGRGARAGGSRLRGGLGRLRRGRLPGSLHRPGRLERARRRHAPAQPRGRHLRRGHPESRDRPAGIRLQRRLVRLRQGRLARPPGDQRRHPRPQHQPPLPQPRQTGPSRTSPRRRACWRSPGAGRSAWRWGTTTRTAGRTSSSTAATGPTRSTTTGTTGPSWTSPGRRESRATAGRTASWPWPPTWTATGTWTS